jgi:hypothetical protein
MASDKALPIQRIGIDPKINTQVGCERVRGTRRASSSRVQRPESRRRCVGLPTPLLKGLVAG